MVLALELLLLQETVCYCCCSHRKGSVATISINITSNMLHCALSKVGQKDARAFRQPSQIPSTLLLMSWSTVMATSKLKWNTFRLKKSGTPRCLHEAKAAPPTPSLVQWKKLFWLPHTAKGNDALRMFMLTPKKPRCPQGTGLHWEDVESWALEAAHLYSQRTCANSSASVQHHADTLYCLHAESWGGQAHSAWYHAAVSMHMLSDRIKMKNWTPAIDLPFVFSVLLNLNCWG